MALQYQLKAGNISNLTDARYFNAHGVEWIGFNLDVLSENSISLKDAKIIKEWLFEPHVVVEAGHHQNRTELVYLCNELQAEAVQIDAQHPLLEEDHFIYPVILETNFEELQKVKFKRILRTDLDIEVLLIKAAENFDWEKFKSTIKGKQKQIERLKRDYKVLIELPFEKEWFVEALELLKPTGIHLSCEVEEEAGLSKVDEYDELLELIELEE